MFLYYYLYEIQDILYCFYMNNCHYHIILYRNLLLYLYLEVLLFFHFYLQWRNFLNLYHLLLYFLVQLLLDLMNLLHLLLCLFQLLLFLNNLIHFFFQNLYLYNNANYFHIVHMKYLMVVLLMIFYQFHYVIYHLILIFCHLYLV